MKDSSTSELAKKNNSKRFNKSVTIHFVSFALGLFSGITLSLHGRGIITLSTNTIIIGTLLLTVCLLILTWAWYKSMDEFEQANFHKAGNLAFHSGFIAIPWFILHELDIFPALDAFYLLFAMSIVFLIYYYSKKFL